MFAKTGRLGLFALCFLVAANVGDAAEQSSASVTYDAAAAVTQVAADHLTSSVAYPLTVFKHSDPFHPARLETKATDGTSEVSIALSAQEVQQLVETSSRTPIKVPAPGEPVSKEDFDKVVGAAYASQAQEAIDKAKLLLQAHEKEQGADADKIRAQLKQLVAGGVHGFAAETARGGCFDFHEQVSYLEAKIGKRPTLVVGAPTTSVRDLELLASVTAQSWAKAPVPRWGWPPWECKWFMVLEVSLRDVRFDVAADVGLQVESKTSVVATGRVNRLRLDYPILKNIPLERIAQPYLDKEKLVVYDAKALVLTVPILGSKFAVDEAKLPNASGQIDVQIFLKQKRLEQLSIAPTGGD